MKERRPWGTGSVERHGAGLWDGGLTTWIGKGEDGKLYIFPGIHNGWSKRKLYRGTLPKNAKEVFAGNAMGTGYLWFDRPLSA